MSLHFRSLYSMSTQAWDGPLVMKHQTSSESARKRKKVNKIKNLMPMDKQWIERYIIIIIIIIIIKQREFRPKAHHWNRPYLYNRARSFPNKTCKRRIVYAKFPIDLLFMISEFMPVCLSLFLKVWYLNFKVIIKEDLIKQNY